MPCINQATVIKADTLDFILLNHMAFYLFVKKGRKFI